MTFSSYDVGVSSAAGAGAAPRAGSRVTGVDGQSTESSNIIQRKPCRGVAVPCESSQRSRNPFFAVKAPLDRRGGLATKDIRQFFSLSSDPRSCRCIYAVPGPGSGSCGSHKQGQPTGLAFAEIVGRSQGVTAFCAAKASLLLEAQILHESHEVSNRHGKPGPAPEEAMRCWA